MIVRAPIVVTMNGAPIIDGGVHIDGDRIADVGEFSKPRASRAEIIELDGCVLLPGLINAHCHLDYTCFRGKIARQKSFTGWIRAINAEKAKLTASDYQRSIADGFREAQRFGTTSIVNLEAFPELIARCLPELVRIWWCAELIDVSAPQKTREIIAAAMNSRRHAKSGGGFGLAPHAPYTASAELYGQCEQIASAENFLLSTHLAESHEEMEMFHDGSGPLFDFLRELGRDMSDCGGVTPVEVFLQNLSAPVGEADSCKWIVAHLNELTNRDLDLLKEFPAKFSITHCPRSHAYFQHSSFAFERLQNLGFNICLATDSLASNSDLSLFAEMREFQTTHGGLSADELLQMITVNPARALGRATELGKIAPGFLADMIALPLKGLKDIHEQIIAFDGDVPWAMVGGRVL
jgi:cytosine/adenosine deaminase-related metal-dependent hydrolase